MKIILNFLFVSTFLVSLSSGAFSSPKQSFEESQGPIAKVSCTSLPDEVLLQVFGYLDGKNLESVQRTCKDWKQIATDGELFLPKDNNKLKNMLQKVSDHELGLYMSRTPDGFKRLFDFVLSWQSDEQRLFDRSNMTFMWLRPYWNEENLSLLSEEEKKEHIDLKGKKLQEFESYIKVLLILNICNYQKDSFRCSESVMGILNLGMTIGSTSIVCPEEVLIENLFPLRAKEIESIIIPHISWERRKAILERNYRLALELRRLEICCEKMGKIYPHRPSLEQWKGQSEMWLHGFFATTLASPPQTTLASYIQQHLKDATKRLENIDFSITSSDYSGCERVLFESLEYLKQEENTSFPKEIIPRKPSNPLKTNAFHDFYA